MIFKLIFIPFTTSVRDLYTKFVIPFVISKILATTCDVFNKNHAAIEMIKVNISILIAFLTASKVSHKFQYYHFLFGAIMLPLKIFGNATQM